MTVNIASPAVHEHDDRAIVWFDIDNTLYSASSKIADVMGERIHAYFLSLGLADDEASELHHKYYKEYGLALRGLVRHHDVDTLDFDRKCDASLPLESMLKPDPKVRQLLQDIDRSKFRVWALTNAYITHASRVLKILNLEDQMEGVVYCDYSKPNFSCKPEPEFFEQALERTGIKDPAKCFFIDDSKLNITAARELGWGCCVHFCETDLVTTEGGIKQQITEIDDGEGAQHGHGSVRSLEGLRKVWPEIFKKG